MRKNKLTGPIPGAGRKPANGPTETKTVRIPIDILKEIKRLKLPLNETIVKSLQLFLK